MLLLLVSENGASAGLLTSLQQSKTLQQGKPLQGKTLRVLPPCTRRDLSISAAALASASTSGAAIAADRATMDSVSTQTPVREGDTQFVTKPSGLKYKDIEVGKGDGVRTGDLVAVQLPK